MRVALFARVSSERQGGEAKLSIPAQLRMMRERCQRESWEVVAEFVAEGESAYTDDLAKRPTLHKAVEAGERREFDILMVHESSRLARNAYLAMSVEKRLAKCGVAILDTNEVFQRKNAEGNLFGTMTKGMNEYWSEKMGEHIRKQKAEAFARGLHVGDTPFGYERAGANLPVRPVPAEAAAVAEGFREYIAGASYTEVLLRWNEEGLRPHSKRGLTQFTIPAMQRIFENDFYAGYIHHLGQRRKGIHEAIISEETWAAAQTRVNRRAPRATEMRMLSGIASCAGCHGPLWLNRSGKTGYQRHYYREVSKERGMECPHRGMSWRADLLESRVSTVIDQMIGDTSWLLRQVDREARRPRAEPKMTREQRARVKWLEESRRGGFISEAQYLTDMAATDAALAPVAGADAIMERGERLFSMRQWWDSVSDAYRRPWLRTVFEEVQVEPKEVLFKPWQEFRPLFQMRADYVRALRSLGPAGSEASKRNPLLFSTRQLVAS